MLIGKKKRRLLLAGIIFLLATIAIVIEGLLCPLPAVRRSVVKPVSNDQIEVIKNEFGLSLMNCTVMEIQLTQTDTFFCFGNQTLSIKISLDDLEQFLSNNPKIYNQNDSQAMFYYHGKNGNGESITIKSAEQYFVIEKYEIHKREMKKLMKGRQAETTDIS